MLLDKEVEEMGPHTFELIRSETPLDLCLLPGKHPLHAGQVHNLCTLLSSQP
jgi:hypothetical protein